MSNAEKTKANILESISKWPHNYCFKLFVDDLCVDEEQPYMQSKSSI